MSRFCFVLLALCVSGCGATFTTAGMENPQVAIVRAMAESQTATIQALTAALSRAQAQACPLPSQESR